MQTFKRLKFILAVTLSLTCIMPAAADSKLKDAPVLVAEQNESVSFNTKTRKYHKLSCKWARKCTKSCVVISLAEAIKRGGVPCKVCGGN